MTGLMTRLPKLLTADGKILHCITVRQRGRHLFASCCDGYISWSLAATEDRRDFLARGLANTIATIARLGERYEIDVRADTVEHERSLRELLRSERCA